MIWRWTWDVNALIAVVIFWIVGVVLLFIVPRNRKPSSATAWLLLISVLPLLGLIFFFLIGSPKLSKRRRAMQCSMSDTIVKRVVERDFVQVYFSYQILLTDVRQYFIHISEV